MIMNTLRSTQRSLQLIDHFKYSESQLGRFFRDGSSRVFFLVIF